MGWQDRDWAKLRDDEIEAIYAFKPVRTSGSPLRALVWSAVGVALLAVVGFALYERPRTHDFAAVQAQPAVLYGDRGMSTAVAPEEPGGIDTVCAEKVERADGSWWCLDWYVNTNHLPVVSPRPYAGPCTHEQMDERAGRWICLSDAPQPATTSG